MLFKELKGEFERDCDVMKVCCLPVRFYRAFRLMCRAVFLPGCSLYSINGLTKFKTVAILNLSTVFLGFPYILCDIIN